MLASFGFLPQLGAPLPVWPCGLACTFFLPLECLLLAWGISPLLGCTSGVSGKHWGS